MAAVTHPTHLTCPCCAEDAVPGRPSGWCYAHELPPEECADLGHDAGPCDVGHGWQDGDEATCPACGCGLVVYGDGDSPAFARVARWCSEEAA